ncbi:MAG: aminoglycoside phosphotransferase family protein [Bacteroidales bacterium]|nr:aminoglycoside phosphotransferase family protein [Bacteroidales bacterium]
MQTDFTEVIQAYGLQPNHCSVRPLGNGHINHTFLVETTKSQRYVLQQLNTDIFKKPEQIAHNWKMAKSHIEKIAPDYPMIAYTPTVKGELLFVDSDNQTWRMTNYFDQTVCFETLDNIDFASKTARAFGRFAALLSQIDVNLFYEILPDFHNLNYRQKQFDQAVAQASAERLNEAAGLIARLNANRWITSFYNEVIHRLPRRIVHMDAKISNVLFDVHQHEVRCLIDLDTLMPATLLSDVGDMIRSMSCAAAEDERDLSIIKIRPGFVEAIVSGYAAEIDDIQPIEKKLLPFGGLMLVYMQALRFLTDFLENDHYYHTRYPGHNLDRARNQETLLSELLCEPLIFGKYPF